MSNVSEAAVLRTLPQELPSDTEALLDACEQFREATSLEPFSLQIWLRYCKFIDQVSAHTSSWSTEELELYQELFPPEIREQVWQQGLEATKLRINDSNLLWDAWIQRRLDQNASVDDVHAAFIERLQIPHATWEDTSQKFSTYLSQHDEANYMDTMMKVTQLAALARKRYESREPWELKLRSCERNFRHEEDNDAAVAESLHTDDKSTNTDGLKAIYADYMDFEVLQSKKDKQGPALCYALYERALLKFPMEASFWLDYVVAIGIDWNFDFADAPQPLAILIRATTHCPSSQKLWTRYMVQAEAEGVDESGIEGIVELAGNNVEDLDSAIMLYSAWCSYLMRNATSTPATRAIETALEKVQKFGVDPTFSIERILIGYLTRSGSIDSARKAWEKLVKTHGTSYDFWQQYYVWALTVEAHDVFRPSATAVLQRAINHRGVDWPEELLKIYARHCKLHGSVETLRSSMDNITRNEKGIARRRLKEMEAASAYAYQQGNAPEAAGVTSETNAAVDIPTDVVFVEKRKREESAELSSSKRARTETTSEPKATEPKRDREHNSVLVTNLAPDVTQTAIKKFFKGYGHINQLELIKRHNNSANGDHAPNGSDAMIEDDKPNGTSKTSIAMIEFSDSQDVDSALLKNGKMLGDYEISVVPARDLTLYVVNFPISEDENDEFMYEHFSKYGEIFPPRWPNKKKKELMANQRRRFAYISFTTPEGAAKALELNGKQFTDKRGSYAMEVMYSDPSRKKTREPKKPKPEHKNESAPPITDSSAAVELADGVTGGSETLVTKKETPKFMMQPPVRRPALGGGRKLKRGG